MKRYIQLFLLLSACIIGGCAKDNFEPPKSPVKGRVVYNGQPIGVKSGAVAFEMWQHGFQLFTKVPLPINQDGTFSALLFDGDYKFTRLAGSGPWVDQTDSIDVKVNGSATLDIPVTPYYWLSNVSFVKNGTAVEATFTVQAINTSKTFERVRLFVGANYILDSQYNNTSTTTELVGSAVTMGQATKLTMTIPASIANDDFIYARVGVKTTGIAEYLYSPSTKIALK